MPFDRPDIYTIYARMKTDLEQRLNHTNWLSRSVILVMLAVFSGAIHLAYGALVKLSKELFFTTADLFLDWHAQLYGLPRKDAEYAATGDGGYKFTGDDDTVIDEGTEVQTSDGIVFLTDSEVTIASGEAIVGLTAKLAGESGNIESDTMTLVTPIGGVDSEGIVLIQPTGGTEQETNDDLIFRLLQRTRNPPGSGNIGDYQRWALEVSGVGRSWTKSAENWKGAGTAAVIIATSSLEIVDAQVRLAVTDYIESKRPIGADVDIEDPVPIACGFALSITPNTELIRNSIAEQLNLIFLLDSSPGGTMLLSHIRKAVATTPVEDFEITEIYKNSVAHGVSNIESSFLELLRFDESTTVFSELT